MAGGPRRSAQEGRKQRRREKHKEEETDSSETRQPLINQAQRERSRENARGEVRSGLFKNLGQQVEEKELETKGNSQEAENATSIEEKMKGLNESFLEAASKAYSINNAYNFNGLFAQYRKYKEEIEPEQEKKQEQFRGLDIHSILRRNTQRAGSEGGSERGSEKGSGVEENTFQQSRKRPMGTEEEPERRKDGEREENGENGKAEGNTLEIERPEIKQERRTIGEVIKRKRRSEDDRDDRYRGGDTDGRDDASGRGEEGAIKVAEGGNSKEDSGKDGSQGAVREDGKIEEVEEGKAADGKVAESRGAIGKEGVNSTGGAANRSREKSRVKEEALFEARCKVYERKSRRFEDIGFHNVSVISEKGEKYLSILDGESGKIFLKTSIDKSSARSQEHTKELAFVNADTSLLYKVKLATIQDADNLRKICLNK